MDFDLEFDRVWEEAKQQELEPAPEPPAPAPVAHEASSEVPVIEAQASHPTETECFETDPVGEDDSPDLVLDTEASRPLDEPDENCAVCNGGDSYEGDAILFCDACDMPVHQSCYGVAEVPDGDWLCEPCVLGVRETAQCVVCPVAMSALKPTDKGHWAHVACALWTPEMAVDDPITMSPIVGVQRIPQDRHRLRCGVCHQTGGAVVQCHAKTCTRAVHVLCGRGRGFTALIQESGASVLFCPLHKNTSASTSTSKTQKHGKKTKKKKKKSQGSGRATKRKMADAMDDLEDDEEEDRVDMVEETVEDVWVACDACNKWRVLPRDSGVDTEGEFHCVMLPDTTCDTAEPTWEEQPAARRSSRTTAGRTSLAEESEWDESESEEEEEDDEDVWSSDRPKRQTNRGQTRRTKADQHQSQDDEDESSESSDSDPSEEDAFEQIPEEPTVDAPLVPPPSAYLLFVRSQRSRGSNKSDDKGDDKAVEGGETSPVGEDKIVEGEEGRADAAAGGNQSNFMAEVSANWRSLGTEEKEHFFSEAARLADEYNDKLEKQKQAEAERRRLMYAGGEPVGSKRRRVQLVDLSTAPTRVGELSALRSAVLSALPVASDAEAGSETLAVSAKEVGATLTSCRHTTAQVAAKIREENRLATRVHRADVKVVLKRLVKNGSAVNVGRRRYIAVPKEQRARALARRKDDRRANGEETAAEARGQANEAMRRATVEAMGRKAKFYLSVWDKLSFFLPEHMRDRVKAKMQQRADEAAETTATADALASRRPFRGQPECVTAVMRPYQLDGLRWLINQHDMGAGGVLGDEMGLGKTLQVLSFLGFLKTERSEGGPHLVVAPLSVMPAWVNEAARWVPSLKVVAFHGPTSERERIKHEQLQPGCFDIVVTTYEMLLAEPHVFVGRFHWRYVILDEAQRVKNESSLIGQAVRRLRSVHRLLITGTPLQNDLHELWALLSFLYPDALTAASAETFDEASNLFRDNSDSDRLTSLFGKAEDLLNSVMLRRLKSSLDLNLPTKTESKVYVKLTEMQKFWYKNLLQKEFALLAGNGAASASKLNSLLMQLRKVCNHPFLFKEADPEVGVTDERVVAASGKMIVLDKLLEKLLGEGHKVLIYSQFTSMLDILQDYLAYRKLKALRLDGGTALARRRYEISLFQNPKSPYNIYLISTRAGGLGITLTAADTVREGMAAAVTSVQVILFDSDWNPTNDAQAMDRVHRIGQKSSAVQIFRLVTEGTVEERILQRAAQKQLLNALVMRDGGGNSGGDAQGAAGEEKKAAGAVARMVRRAAVALFAGGTGDGENDASVDIDALLQASSQRAELDEEEDNGNEEEEVAKFRELFDVRSFEGKSFATPRDGYKTIADGWADTTGPTRQRSTVVKLSAEMQSEETAPAKVERPGRAWRHTEVCVGCLGKAPVTINDDKDDKTNRKRTACDSSEETTLLRCGRCPVSFHTACLPQTASGARPPVGQWICPSHRCSRCDRTAHQAGGLLFRCGGCHLGWCDGCLPDGFEAVEQVEAFDAIGFQLTRTFE